MRFFLRKNGEKIRFFIAFPAIFRDFCKIEKNSQVQNFWRILKGAPCKYTGRSWADHGQIMGRSWADHGQIMSRSWALVDFQRRSERLSRKKADNRADNRYLFPLKSGLTIGEKSWQFSDNYYLFPLKTELTIAFFYRI